MTYIDMAAISITIYIAWKLLIETLVALGAIAIYLIKK